MKRTKINININDISSIIHILFGLLSSIFDFRLEATVIFSFYQFIDIEPPEEKLGDIVEFSIGLLIGSAIKFLLGIR